MIEELLPYYEKQLQEFSQQSRDFAQQYPKIAQRLSLHQEQIDDPHIERLIQAFALIAARIDKKLADSYDIFTHALFEVMFPQYLKHFPSCTVVSFEDINKQKQLNEVHLIPRHTALKSRSFKGVQCEFQTSMEVRLLPIQLSAVTFRTQSNTQLHLHQNAHLTFSFDILNQSATYLDQEILPIYLDAISNFPLYVLDSIFKAETRFSILIKQQRIEIPNPFKVFGFEEDASLLPLDQHTHHAYQLLLEYFCFPERFNYLYLDLAFIQQLQPEQVNIDLQIHFKLNLNDQAMLRNFSELSLANFRLFTTPAINLFEKQAEPQKINHQQLEYPLITDAHHPELYQLYTIINMHMVREKKEQQQVIYPVYPFFSMSHYHAEDVQFFYSLNSKLFNGPYIATGYSIISKKLEPDVISSDFISAKLLCSNRELPYEILKSSQHSLNLNDSSMARRAIILKRPSQIYNFEHTTKEQWRIISHLSLNALALMKGDALSHIKELLVLYNLPKSKHNQLIIDSIQSIEFDLTHKLIEAKPFPMFVRGIAVRISVNPQTFHGHSLYIFSQLLSHIFSLKVHLNSFVDLTIIDSVQQQELYRCIQNIGGKNLL